MKHLQTLAEVRNLSAQIIALREERDAGHFNHAKALNLQHLERKRAALQSELPRLRLVSTDSFDEDRRA